MVCLTALFIHVSDLSVVRVRHFSALMHVRAVAVRVGALTHYCANEQMQAFADYWAPTFSVKKPVPKFLASRVAAAASNFEFSSCFSSLLLSWGCVGTPICNCVPSHKYTCTRSVTHL